MNAELRKSAGSDIKRLQEMVKRLEEQNAQLKYSDNRRVTSNRALGEDNMVKVKLNLDDVPLLDFNTMVEEDEDTWLYVSPSHPPSAEQKKVSPYKYLKDSLDVPELNKVRGSLLAKLESIAAQEEALSRSPPHASVDGHHSSAKSRPSYDNRLGNTTVPLSDDEDDDEDECVQVKPRRRVPMPSSNQDDSDLVVRGPVRRRGAASTGVPKNSRPINDDNDSDDDSPPCRPQRRVPAFNSPSQEDSSLVVKGPLKRRGPSPQPRASLDVALLQMDDADDNDGMVLQRHGQVSQDQEDLVVKGPVRRRGAPPQARQPVATGPLRRRGESPQPRASFDAASLQMDDADDNDGMVPQRRGQVPQDQEDLVVKGPVRRRGAPPQARQPLATGMAQTSRQVDNDEEHVQPRRRVPAASSHYQDDFNSSWQREEMKADVDVPIVTAVRRREPNQVRRREPAVRSRTAEDVEVRRRSLPQTPSQMRPVPGQVTATKRSNTPPHSPSPRKPVTPRAGQLAAPRRIPTPRGVSPARSDDSWSEGFY